MATMGIAQADSSQDVVWTGGLKQMFFGDRTIIESEDVVELIAPARAEDAAVVPISISAKMPQTEDRYIRELTLLIDRNPVPLGGRFQFSPRSGRADLALRVRVNEYTPVRVIAETNDGKLYMSRRFVKASGGCSAPPGTNLAAAMQRLGNMKIRVDAKGALPSSPVLTQLRVSHPNITGLQMDQLTRLYTPAHFIRKIEVTYNGQAVMSGETDISISENPSFRFFFVPTGKGELVAVIEDSNGLTFTRRQPFDPSSKLAD